jgi:hypothetical protein
MDLSVEMFILITAVVIVAGVAYLQLRYMRGRRKVNVDAAIERDDAYNAVTTTKAVAASLRQSGRDTTEADLLLYKAEGSLERREFVDSIDLAKRAKILLMNSKERDPLMTPEPAIRETREESKDVPSNETRKLPANLLESKFIIDSVRDALPGMPPVARLEAEKHLALAEASFKSADYGGALKEALRAKRSQAPAAPMQEKARSPAVIRIPPPAKAVPAPRACPNCRSEALNDDAFCRKCGARIDS